MILASIILKLGGVGIFRIGGFLNFSILKIYFFSYFLFRLVIRGIICLFQTDLKKVIAFSSIFHIRIIPICLTFCNLLSIKVFILGIVLHGIISPILFLMVGILYEREKTRQIFLIKNIIFKNPLLIILLVFFFLSSLPTPPFISFIQEI